MSTAPQVTFPDNEETVALKRRFAEAYLRMPQDAYGAALSVEGHAGRAAWIAYNWIFDTVVTDHMAALQTTGGAAVLIPSHPEFAKQLYDDLHKVKDPETKLKYYKLLAETMGYLKKEAEPAQTVNHNHKVMLYPAFASDDEWEKAAMAQQKRLLEEAPIIEHAR